MSKIQRFYLNYVDGNLKDFAKNCGASKEFAKKAGEFVKISKEKMSEVVQEA